MNKLSHWGSLTRGPILWGAVFVSVTVGHMFGCAPTSAKFEGNVNRVERSLDDLRAYQAEQTAQISALQTQLRELTGRLDEVEHAQTARMSADVGALQQDLSSLKRRVPPPAMVPAVPLEEDEALAANRSDDAAHLLMDALGALREGNYSEALLRLKDSLNVSYGGELTPTVLFWTGVAFDGSGDTKKALAAYNEIVTQYPKYHRAALALLRQGSVFIRLGDSKVAALTFKKLISTYPKSPEADQAKARLKDL